MKYYKRNAKVRGKVWDLSREYFTKLCEENNFLTLKGRTRFALSLDRIVNELGYVEGNVRVIPVHANASKGTKPVENDYPKHYGYPHF